MRVFCIRYFSFFAVLLSASVALSAEEPSPGGLKTIQVTEGYKIILPEGAKIEQTGSQIKVQDPTEYLLHKIPVLEERLTKIEQNQEQLKKQLSILEEIINFLDAPPMELLDQLKKQQEVLRQELELLKVRDGELLSDGELAP